MAVPDAPRTATGAVDLDALVRACGPADLLESADGTGWSYVVPHTGVGLVDDGTRTRWHDAVDGGPDEDLGTDPFTAIDRVCDRLGVRPDAVDVDHDAGPAFTGGLVGALAYDLGHRVEHLPRRLADDRGLPHLWLQLADLVVAVAPARDRVLVVGRELTGRGDLARRAEALGHRLRAAPPATSVPVRSDDAPLTSSLDRRAHLAAVRAVLDHVAAGDVFQVNLTQRLTSRWEADLGALYRALRERSPAPFGAALPAVGLASVSPETFLRVDGRSVATRPIKGTRPRHRDPELDAALADDLATSVKDRAENVMVVDLERNDLGRVCVPGSVRVPELATVEAHPTVWHLVSTVSATLRDDVGYGELLRATFPCGSITGAPKIAAMRIIERLETARRGWYCGAVGFLSPGAARLSVAIRTATLHADGTVDYGAGGGIVADSDPADERHESFDKAAAFLRAVRARRPEQR
ncbi:aminodeoxychorismate synthase component I [Egicoccus halophilus]|uniref:aminodeoxychorismate synthase n=1 Tax=Egicoccus halophilus TaxID=1670830 RepID=A0A8J3AA42_9ACTN|nr:aminodeoxychorismate synthase component I [Egicoccus halophilus]GGI08220.1 aminodeoxychorismate synthase, component I [Egicoccus halophilus]